MSSSHGTYATARHVGHSRRANTAHLPITALSLVKLFAASILQPTLSYAAPLGITSLRKYAEDEPPKAADDPDLWVYLGTAVALVLLGGAFAGLTIALMGQDEIYLQVIATSGEGAERRHARKVLNLLKKGKHWVLVTLLLSNVITNETLPIVLDRSLGGGWPAVVSSTVLIVIFGEIAPQSVCVRYGLTIGSWMAPAVLALMWIMAPVAWPTAKLLDWLLGEDHGTTYKKAGLKTLVTLHKSLGSSPTDRLNEDEVTIISAVLDLKEKAVGDIMTPMEDVFVMSADTVLDEAMMDTILSQGYSRIPIYAPENPTNFIGMLLVKILITYDPEDCLRVRDFALATLPETAPETSCLDIVNFFQEGKSHMVLVSENPGQDKGALGVLTLEDVIEELIGEEIIDESDVFIDVHRAIRRMAPAPRTRYTKQNTAKEAAAVHDTDTDGLDQSQLTAKISPSRKSSLQEPRETTFLLRRRSSGQNSGDKRPMAVRSSTVDIRQHLKHLGPSNAASKPKATKYTSVKIKPGVSTIPEALDPTHASVTEDHSSLISTSGAPDGGIGAGLVESAGTPAKDGTFAVQQGYGTLGTNPPIVVAPEEDFRGNDANGRPGSSPQTAAQATEQARLNADKNPRSPSDGDMRTTKSLSGSLNLPSNAHSRPGSNSSRRNSTSSTSTLGELGSNPRKPRRQARTGSITENHVNVGGMKKIVLETHSDTEDEGDGAGSGSEAAHVKPQHKKKSRNRKKHKPKNKKVNGSHQEHHSDANEDTSPLLGRT